MPDLSFAFLTLFVFGIKDVINKKILETNDVYSLLLTEYVLAMPFLIGALAIFSTFAFPSGNMLWLIVFSSLVGAVSIIAYFRAIQSSSVSLIFAVASSFPFFSALFSVLFLKEPFYPLYYLALPAIIIALAMLAYKKGGIKNLFDPAIVLALISSIGWGAFFTAAKVVSLSMNAFNASVWMEGGVLLGIALFFLLQKKKITLSKAGNVPAMLLSYVVLFSIGVVSMNLSLLYAGVSLSSMITAAAPGLTAIIAFLVLKEKLSKLQYAGIALLIASVVMLSL